MLTQDFIEEMKQRLLSEKDRLKAELLGLNEHTELGDEDDDASTELQIDEVSNDLILRITNDLEKIEKALLKISEGTYGTDDDGKEIGEARLKAIPWADKAI